MFKLTYNCFRKLPTTMHINHQIVSRQLRVLRALDALALLLALWFVESVIGNSLDLIRTGIKNAPASHALILSILLIAWLGNMRKRLSLLNIIVLTILATSGTIWILGVHR